MKFGVTVARDFTDDYNGWPVVNCTKASFADPKGIVSPRYVSISFTFLAEAPRLNFRSFSGSSGRECSSCWSEVS